jgi:hypothetical protein
MALLSGSLFLRVIPSDLRGGAAVSGFGGLWLRCVADLASNLARALRAALIEKRGSLPLRSGCAFSMNFVAIEL